MVLFLLGPSVAARIVLVPISLAIMNISACRLYILTLTQRIEEERARKAKIIQKLGMRIDRGSGPSDSALTLFGGVKVTKTVEISFS